MGKLLIIFLAALLVFTAQISILPAISWFLLQLICLPLIFISCLALLSPILLSLFAGVALGLFMDLYSPYFFGFYTLVFLLSIMLIKFFHLNFFQHKNLGSLLVANLLALLVFKVFSLASYFLSGASALAWPESLFFFGQIIAHCFLVVIIYFLPGPLGRAMRPSTIAWLWTSPILLIFKKWPLI